MLWSSNREEPQLCWGILQQGLCSRELGEDRGIQLELRKSIHPKTYTTSINREKEILNNL